jgi:hypothetical protein
MAEQPETVAGVAELYLGNILYALERCALSMAEEGRSSDAAFYRGIGRALAEARGKTKESPPVNEAG